MKILFMKITHTRKKGDDHSARDGKVIIELNYVYIFTSRDVRRQKHKINKLSFAKINLPLALNLNDFLNSITIIEQSIFSTAALKINFNYIESLRSKFF